MQTHLGETIRRLRKSSKVSQEELAKLLSLHQTAVCRIEQGSQSLLPCHLDALSKFFGVKVDSLLIGKINYFDVAKRFGQPIPLPPRYSELPYSKVREVLPMLQFLNATKGPVHTQKMLSKLDLDSISYLGPDQILGTNCNLDIVRHSIQEGLLNKKNFSRLIDQTRREDVHGFLHPIYETQTSALHLLQTLLLNTHHYETNFSYEIEELHHDSLVISATPREHMRQVKYQDDVLTDFLCRYRKGYLAHFPQYIGRKPLSITEKDCHFHGKARCTYRIIAA